jgi:hypothetical protein
MKGQCSILFVGMLLFCGCGLVNHPPTAANDAIDVREGAAATRNLAEKGKDPDGDRLTVVEIKPPANGKVSTDGQSVTYTPAARFYGSDSFQYCVSDGKLTSSPATVTVRILPAAQQFWRTNRASTLDEMLQEPGSSVYGTSINIWAYRGADKPFDQVVVTGHADSSTCRNVSGLLYNAFLQKNREPEDLLVAGTGLLKKTDDPDRRGKLEKTAAVRNYRQLDKELASARFLLRLVELQRTTPEEGTSAIRASKDDVARLEKAVAEAAKADDVQQYLLQSRSADAMSRFVAEATRIAEETGLVRVHQLDAQLSKKAQARIDEALNSGRDPGYVRFDDLTKSVPDGMAVIIVPVTRLATKQPLVLTLPLAKLDPGSLKKSLEESRQDVTFAMVGNANSRLAYLTRKRKDTAEQLDNYQRLLAAHPEERKRQITLGMTITPDGDFKSAREETTTLGEYIDFRLPQNLRIFDQWLAETHQLLDAIERDSKEKDQGAIEHIAYSTMVDSMLRDWALPVGRSQRAFEQWRATQRQPIWDVLNESLESSGIKKNAVSGENIVFSVSLAKDGILIRPVHVVDLRHSVLMFDKRLGVTRVVDSWAQRGQVATAAIGRAARESQARAEIEAMHNALRHADLGEARTCWARACKLNARVAVESLLQEWSNEFPGNTSLVDRLNRELAPRIQAQELFAEWTRINSDPRFKEEDKQGEYLLAIYRFLEANPRAPVEMQLRFLVDLAHWIAVAQREITHQDDTTTWDVLDRLVVGKKSEQPEWIARYGRGAKRPTTGLSLTDLLKPTSIAEAESLQRLGLNKATEDSNDEERSFYRARQVVSKALLSGEDPAKLLKKIADLARTNDADFTNRTLANHASPSELSAGYQRLTKETSHALTEFEFDALRLEKVRQMMTSRAAADLASTLLLFEDTPPFDEILGKVNESLRSDLGSQNTHFRAAQQQIQSVIELGKGANPLQVAEIVGALENGKRWLLSHSDNELRNDSRNRGLREVALLEARLQFENGQYNTAINDLFDESVALALYHPDLIWTALSGDWIGRPQLVRAEATQSGTVHVVARQPKQHHALLKLPIPQIAKRFVFRLGVLADPSLKPLRQSCLLVLSSEIAGALSVSSLFSEIVPREAWTKLRLEGPQLVMDESGITLDVVVLDHDVRVLDLSGLPADARQTLVEFINATGPRNWTNSMRVSEQLLLQPMRSRPVLARFKQLFQGPKERASLIKAMVYGLVLPDAKSFPGSGRWLETSRSRPIYDQVLTSAGSEVHVPSVSDLVAQIQTDQVVQNILPSVGENVPRQHTVARPLP